MAMIRKGAALLATLLAHALYAVCNAGYAASYAALSPFQVQQLEDCLKRIPGQPELKLPGSPNYALFANGLRIIRLHTPAAVVFPVNTQQVQAAVLCAVRSRVQPIPRSGGGSFENLSTADGALVIDLSNMASVKVDVDSMTAVVQTGIRTGNLYTVVHQAGRARGKNITCLGVVWPQVGFGGVLTTGGYGSLSRKYGVLPDHILSASAVTAQGTLLEASTTKNPDLFWALRGGGGGTFGVVVEATMRLVEVPVATTGFVRYKGLDHAVQVLDRFQRWAPTAPRELTFSFSMYRGGMEMQLYFLGGAAELRTLILGDSGLAAFPSASFVAVACDPLGARWYWWNSGKPLACNLGMSVPQRMEPGNSLAKDREAAKYRSAFFRRPIPPAGLQEIKELLSAPGRHWQMFLWVVFGGVFEDLAVDFNAYPHRKGLLMMAEYGTSFGYGSPADQVPTERGGDAFEAAAWGWYRKAKAVVAKYETGEHDIGHVSLDDDDVASYFGPNYGRLQRIKKVYDPDNLFRSPVSVRAA